MLRRTILLGLATLAPLAGTAARAGEVLSIGVVPQFEQRKLFAAWRPVVDEVRRFSGLDLRLASMLTVPEFEAELGRGTFDIVFASAFAVQRFGYLPLARDSEPLRGIVVVRKNSPLRDPHELNGRTLAVPSTNALGPATARTQLAQQFQAVVTTVNARTHSGVYSAVLAGQADAGAAVEQTLRLQDPSIREQLRVIHTTQDLPAHVFATHPRVGDAVRDTLLRALLDVAASPLGNDLLGRIPLGRLAPATQAEYPPHDGWGVKWVEGKE